MLQKVREFIDPDHPIAPTEQKERNKVIAAARHLFWDEEADLLYNIWFPARSDVRRDSRKQIVVPQALVRDLLYEHHNSPLGGHLGAEKMFQRMREKYWWPSIHSDIVKWVRSCEECQQRRGSKAKPRVGQLIPIETSRPRQIVAIDIMTLPTSIKGNSYVVVMTDLFTKWVEVVSLADQTAKTVANAFFNEWVCRHGAPTQLLSDRGGQFLSELMKELHTILGVRSIHTTAYHAAAGNGAVERINGILCDMLSKYVREDQKDWEFHLPGILLVGPIEHLLTRLPENLLII